MLTAYAAGLAGIAAALTVVWLVSLRLKDASIVDICWGSGFILATAVYAALSPEGNPERKALSFALVAIWGLRLSAHIALRNAGKGEDYRYANWRKKYGTAWWWRSWFQVFALQSVLLWIVSAPLLAAQFSSLPLGPLDWIGAAVWAVGLFFESIGDWQLARFKADSSNAGKVMQTGLWRYTRHPNYFGDAVVWWGLYLLALAGGGWWTIFSPLLMTYLLTRISGVAMLESALKSKKPEYRDYIRRTSAFVPWPPKD